MYTWYSNHKGGNVFYTIGSDLDIALADTRGMADASAKRGVDALYRLFGPAGFVVSFSVLGGVVRELNSPTIPDGHW